MTRRCVLALVTLALLVGDAAAQSTLRDAGPVREAFAPAAGDVSRAVVRVLVDGRQAALGVVVRRDGIVLTKASEAGGQVSIGLADGRTLPAAPIGVADELDLALFRVEAVDLPAVALSDEPLELPVGTLVAAAGCGEAPLAIGVIGAPRRRVPNPGGLLGVLLEDGRESARIVRVVPGSGAEQAALHEGDEVVAIDGLRTDSRMALASQLRQRMPGTRVTLEVRRDGERVVVDATLGQRSERSSRAEIQNRMGGGLNNRASGFAAALQHDLALAPTEVGGPLVDLEGRVVGINIARAGRTESLAIPADAAADAVARLLATAQP